MRNTSGLVVAATEIEAKLFCQIWTGSSSFDAQYEVGKIYGLVTKNEAMDFDLLICGIGQDAARDALLSYLKKNAQPAWLILTGFAGGLSRSLTLGDTCIPKTIKSKSKEFVADVYFYRCVEKIYSQNDGVFKSQHLYSAEHMVSTPVEKAALYAATQCEIVDMEAAAIAQICENNGIAWLVVKTVLDESHQPLSPYWAKMVDRFGKPRWFAFMLNLIVHPSILPELIKFMPDKLAMHMKQQVMLVQQVLTQPLEQRKTI